jgi:hypothetical protein
MKIHNGMMIYRMMKNGKTKSGLEVKGVGFEV